MISILLLVVLAVIAVIAIGVGVGRLRVHRRLAHEMRAISHTQLPASLVALPAPVERYRQLAIGRRVPVQTLRVVHGGTFRMSPATKASAIRGTELFTANPPSFVWIGRVQMLPGVWVDPVVPVVQPAGAPLDHGSALRLLAEMVWYPTSLFDARHVTWSAIDANHARATLRTGGAEVSGIFEFGSTGLPARMTADAFTDKGEPRAWGAIYRDWRTVSGMRVPFDAEVTWQLASGPCTYAHWRVESMTFDAAPERRRSMDSLQQAR